MRKLLVSLTACSLLVSSLVAGSTVAGIVATAAAPDCRTSIVIGSTMSPDTVTLGPGQVASVQHVVRVQGDCVGLVLADDLSPTFAQSYRLRPDDLEAESFAASVGAEAQRSALPAAVSIWRHRSLITSDELTNADAGTWHTRVYGGGPQRFADAGADFKVLRSSHLRVRRVDTMSGNGRGVSIGGHLSRADWDHDRFSGYGAQTIELQRKSASGAYQKQRTVQSHRHGQFRVTLGRAGGCFRLVFRGSNTTASSSRSVGCIPAEAPR